MKIAIFNLEPHYTNIALEKIKLYHKNRKDHIEKYFELKHFQYDKIYCSSIFTDTFKPVITEAMICGGTGFNLKTKLPPEIEEMKPKIDIGFTSRGCIRKCPWCVVPQKEGPFEIIGDIYDFISRSRNDIKILDNNILADKKHFIRICKQLIQEDLIVDFNQGLDCRLIDKDICHWLQKIRINTIRFAWDDMRIESAVRKAIKLLHKHDLNYCTWYILVGYNTTFKEDLYRCRVLKDLDQRVYIQKYNNKKDDPMLRAITRWGNNRAIFSKVTFKEFLNYSGCRGYMKKIIYSEEVKRMSIPVKEKSDQAKKNKTSLMHNFEKLDVYTEFKIVCATQGITLREGLREAVQDYFKKYNV